jgi:hypothetical protein
VEERLKISHLIVLELKGLVDKRIIGANKNVIALTSQQIKLGYKKV